MKKKSAKKEKWDERSETGLRAGRISPFIGIVWNKQE